MRLWRNVDRTTKTRVESTKACAFAAVDTLSPVASQRERTGSDGESQLGKFGTSDGEALRRSCSQAARQCCSIAMAEKLSSHRALAISIATRMRVSRGGVRYSAHPCNPVKRRIKSTGSQVATGWGTRPGVEGCSRQFQQKAIHSPPTLVPIYRAGRK